MRMYAATMGTIGIMKTTRSTTMIAAAINQTFVSLITGGVLAACNGGYQ